MTINDIVRKLGEMGIPTNAQDNTGKSEGADNGIRGLSIAR